MILHVIGAPGSGKTHFATALADRLDLPRFSIDEERVKLLKPGQHWPDDDADSWSALRAGIDAYPVTIVETYTLAPQLADYESVTVLVDTPATIRHERVRERAHQRGPLVGHPRIYFERLTSLPAPRVRAEFIWDGTADVESSSFDSIAAALLSRTGFAGPSN